MKKIISFFFILMSILILSSCQNVDDEIEIKYKNYKITNYDTNYSIDATSLNGYYVNDSDLLYVDLYEFLMSLDGLYQTQYINRYVALNNKTYNLYWNYSDGTNVKRMLFQIDWDNDTIYVNDSRFFALINETNLEYIYKNFTLTASQIDEEKPQTYDLKDYGFNIYYKLKKCLIPFCLANTLFCSNNYHNMYFNGQWFFGVYYDISSVNEYERSLILSKDSSFIESEESRLNTYNHFRFVMDNYYGLKAFKGIFSFDDYFKDYKDSLLSTDPKTYFKAYENILIENLNELHTRIGDYGIFNPDKIEKYTNTTKGQKLMEYRNTASTLKSYASQSTLRKFRANSNYSYLYYPNVRFDFTESLMFMHVPGFDVGSEAQLQQDDKIYYDTFEFFKYAMKEADKKNVKDIVVDLSLNGGGVVAALLKALGFINQDNLKYEMYNTQSGTFTIYDIKVDTNDDGLYDSKDVYSKYNWFVLSSPVTFSAANAFTCIAHNLGAKTIGKHSGGGMCAVLPIVLNDGTTIEVSSPNALYANNLPTESGVDVDIEIDYIDFYDVEAIKQKIDNSRK